MKNPQSRSLTHFHHHHHHRHTTTAAAATVQQAARGWPDQACQIACGLPSSRARFPTVLASVCVPASSVAAFAFVAARLAGERAGSAGQAGSKPLSCFVHTLTHRQSSPATGRQATSRRCLASQPATCAGLFSLSLLSLSRTTPPETHKVSLKSRLETLETRDAASWRPASTTNKVPHLFVSQNDRSKAGPIVAGDCKLLLWRPLLLRISRVAFAAAD